LFQLPHPAKVFFRLRQDGMLPYNSASPKALETPVSINITEDID